MIKFFFGMCCGAAFLFGYQHYNSSDVKAVRSKAVSTWKATEPARDKAERAVKAATSELKK